MRKHYFLIVPLLWALCTNDVCAQSVERQSLTLEQMFELAEQNNNRIKAHTTAVRQAVEEVKVAKNAYLPSIETSLSVSYNSDGTILDRDFGNAFTAEIPDFGNNFIVEVSQVIYAGGAIRSGIELSGLKAQITSLHADRNRQEVRFLIVGNYLEISKLSNQVEVLDSHISQTEKVLEEMRIRHEQGTALHNDITRYELQLQNLRYTKTTLLNAKQLLNNQLTMALGLPESVEIQTDSIDIANLNEKNATQWQDIAAQTAIPLQMAEKAIQINKQQKRLTHAERLPKVALFAMNNLTGPVTIEIPALNKNFNYWAVGVGITYQFDNLYKTNKKIKANKLSIQRAQEEMLVAQEEVRLGMQAAYSNYRDAYTLLETKEKSVELARQNYDVVNYRYANDLALITDLLDASSQKLDAELQAVNARINILFNYYKLHYISGTL
ncbi:MAG: TolC family protein [Bacteroidaceae bacterium]|nr:TolC family protein [Bacteroidaceae bacterium]